VDLKEIFMGNFQGTYIRLGNPWDLKSCRQKTDESLCDYIQCFSRQCNELPNIANADVISTFLFGTTNKILVHKLGQRSPWTTKELLDIATSDTLGEEAVEEIFDRTMIAARPSRMRTLAKVPPTAQRRRGRTSHGPMTRTWLLLSARAKRHPSMAP
jgi:hypothetical protein